MTYGNLKNLVSALLIGDNTLTKNNDEVLVLLEYAFDKVANQADALKLFTTDIQENRILRQGPGRMFLKRPSLPSSDDDELDIDNELTYAVARYICSFVSREKTAMHIVEADNIIRAYNQKVQTYFETLEQYGELDEWDKYDQFGRRVY